jgi:hypothetical protein
MTDGMLLHPRDTYPIETAWAPAWVGDELRRARTGAQETRLASIRANAEAEAAQRRREREQASRQQVLAASYQAIHDAYRERETVFAAVMADRADWDRATRQQRHLAVAADAELRRRHPDQHYLPLRSAEPQPPTQAQRDELTFTAGEHIPPTGQWITDLAAQHSAFAEKMVERDIQAVSAKDPGPAFPSWAGARQDAILRPPKPQIQPSTRILERIPQHDLDMEATE